MTVIASADELGGDQAIEQVANGGESGQRGLPLRIQLLQPLAFGLAVCASFGILTRCELAKQAGTDVLADDAAVHLMAASVVATAAVPALPTHGVV